VTENNQLQSKAQNSKLEEILATKTLSFRLETSLAKQEANQQRITFSKLLMIRLLITNLSWQI